MAADLTYYTIDDLRLGQRRSDGPGWRLSEFGLRSDAFRHYRSLDAEKVKALGVTSGTQALDLGRRIPAFSVDKTGAYVLVTDYDYLLIWLENPRCEQLDKELKESF